MAFGSPGGDRQDQWPFMHFRTNLQRTMEGGRVSINYFPNSFYQREYGSGDFNVETRMPSHPFERRILYRLSGSTAIFAARR